MNMSTGIYERSIALMEAKSAAYAAESAEIFNGIDARPLLHNGHAQAYRRWQFESINAFLAYAFSTLDRWRDLDKFMRNEHRA